ncbi:hypothetical protein B0F90DRAFT_424553 [Multifurca ochricompacta]|uniref:RING-type domain-containing protein n=1 Tax=Multifurca ochricompacta TaxID=376703 RepID=A0AAD4M401_9AGAM|nr:hypothetical protein B0F90DRAFT_424553 [Multifurca ochricompacta]
MKEGELFPIYVSPFRNGLQPQRDVNGCPSGLVPSKAPSGIPGLLSVEEPFLASCLLGPPARRSVPLDHKSTKQACSRAPLVSHPGTFASPFLQAMLIVKPSSSCDVCLESFQLRGESSAIVRAPCAIDCGHVFCSTCIDSFTRLACPLCRSYFDPRAVRRLHIDVAPQTPDNRPVRIGHPDNDGVAASKEDLKERIISIVRNGADGGHYQALIQETCAWLKEQTPEEHWDLRALYLLLIRYHQMHKDEQAATVSLHEKTRLYQDALRKAEKRQQEIAELKQSIEDLKDKMDANEVRWAVREKQLTMKYEEAIEETRSLREQLITFCAPKGRPDRHRSSEARLTSQRVFEPMVEDECTDDTLMKPITDHFSPLPVHLSPIPSMLNAVSPLVRNAADSMEEEDHYFKPRLQPSEDGDQTPVEYPPPLVSTPASKPMVIGATIARFYDMAASETSASLPHPTPSAYYNRRHEKEKEKQRELSRNNSSGSTGRVALSRIKALQEKLVPESGDEAERARSTRRQLLNAILADAPTPQSTPAPIVVAPPPPTPPPPPPPPSRPIAISHASTAAQEIERERERRRRQSSENRAPETTSASVPPPPQPQVLAQRLAHPRPSIPSLKDASNSYGGEDGIQRRHAYPERRSANERRPSIGKSQWHRSSPTEA